MTLSKVIFTGQIMVIFTGQIMVIPTGQIVENSSTSGVVILQFFVVNYYTLPP